MNSGNEGLTIGRIEAVNILKFDRFELDSPGKLTVFRGANNQGKTTALRLLGLCFNGTERGGDPSRVVHDGATKGEINIKLSNGYSIRRSFTQKDDYLTVRDEKGHKVDQDPQTFLRTWLGEYRDFNPLAWLSMDAKDQVRVLLQAIDVRLTPAEFKTATALDAPDGIDFGGHGLLVLDALRAHYADERKLSNRIVAQKQSAALEARATLPAAMPTISAERRAEVAAAVTEAQQLKEQFTTRQLAASNHAAAVERMNESIRGAQSEHERLDGDIKRKLAEIDRLNSEIGDLRGQQKECTARAEQYHRELATLASSAPPTDEEKESVNAKLKAARVLKTELEAAEKAIDDFKRAKESVELLEQEALNAKAESAIIDSTIRVLDIDLRGALMAKAALPVNDLTIEDGRILVDNHELQYLAESQRIRIAVAIARALRPALRVIVLDGAEQLDAATFALFLEEIRGDGFTYLASEVDRNGGALEIVVFGEDLQEKQQKAVA